jgi:hypothetical protein
MKITFTYFQIFRNPILLWICVREKKKLYIIGKHLMLTFFSKCFRMLCCEYLRQRKHLIGKHINHSKNFKCVICLSFNWFCNIFHYHFARGYFFSFPFSGENMVTHPIPLTSKWRGHLVKNCPVLFILWIVMYV